MISPIRLNSALSYQETDIWFPKMSEAETEELLESMRKQTEKITSSRESALKFLQKAGILDEEGDFSEPYKKLGAACTALTQD